ncbi:MAG: LysR family transcriptional regulator [Gammaproteobacteria bacterium]|nr:LysR family transcriptional regulator [Gammaproteobacteria bacterium]
MQLINLRTFITVSRTGGFHAAAERLNITQAAVSARIKALEDQLGQRLFDRGRRGATLTVAGRGFLPHAENISHTWDHAKSMLGAPASKPVQLSIGSQFSTWAQLILDWTGWIANSLPEAELFLDFDFSKDMLNAVQNGELDLAITSAPSTAHGMRILALSDETLILVARRPLSLNNEAMPPYIQMDWGPQFNSQIIRMENHLPHSRLSIGNGELGLRYVLEHDVCGYFPLRTIRAHLQQNRLYRVKRAPRFSFGGYVVYNEDNPNRPFIERAVDWLKGIETDRDDMHK